MKLRFPAPTTGLLHVASARIALANWLLARRHGGTFVLRLEDVGDDRTRPEWAEAIEHDLHWLGLDWDQITRHSDRQPQYQAAADRLKAAGRLYPCFESDAELESKREARQRRGQSPIYDRAMLKLTPKQRAQAEANGKSPYWRFRLDGTPAEWGDMVLGRQQVKLSAVSDPVLIRADGTPLPALTAAIDDMEQGITHLVRSQDHLTATGIHIDILAALGGRPAGLRLAHLPALAPDPASKRPAALSLRALRTDGIEPTALAAYLSGLGTFSTPPPDAPARLASAYDPSRIAKAAPRFDPAELLALNRRALAATPFEAVQDRLPPAATPAFWNAIRAHIDLLREARGWWDVAAGTIVPPLVENEAEYLGQARQLLPPEPWDTGTWPAWTAALAEATGRPLDAVDLPLRLALTGEDDGPDLADLLPLIGRARAAERLAVAAS